MEYKVIWKPVNQGDLIDLWLANKVIKRKGILNAKVVGDTRTDSLVITSTTEVGREALLEVQEIGGIPITAEPCLNANKLRRIIKCPLIRGKTSEEVCKNLAHLGVLDVEKKGEGGTFILTFNEKPPKMLEIGCITVPTHPFVPRPMLCRKCFTYGHPDNVCKNKSVCTVCGQEHGKKCSGKVKCRNCNGAHLATWGGCPVWKQEMAIRRIMATKDISGKVARSKYQKKGVKYYPLTRGTSADPEPQPGPSGIQRPTPKKQLEQIILESSDEEPQQKSKEKGPPPSSSSSDEETPVKSPIQKVKKRKTQ